MALRRLGRWVALCSRWGDRTQVPPLPPGETLLRDVFAEFGWLTKRGRGVRGRLIVTDVRLIFLRAWPRFAPTYIASWRRLEIPLGAVSCVTSSKGPWSVSEFTVHTKSGKAYRFRGDSSVVPLISARSNTPQPSGP